MNGWINNFTKTQKYIFFYCQPVAQLTNIIHNSACEDSLEKLKFEYKAFGSNF